MIDFQSPCISACVLECGGHDAALRSIQSTVSISLPVQESVFIGVHPWLKKKVEIAKRTQFSSQVVLNQKETKKNFPFL